MAHDKRDKHEHKSPDQGEMKIIPVNGSEPEPAAAAETPAQPDPIEALQARVAELEDLRLRALAEVDNTRKRMNRQMDEALRSANDRLLVDLLEVVDNFERALKHANGDGAAEPNTASGIKTGTELIYNQLLGLLGRYDVRPMETVGRQFDPVYHEALAHMETNEYAEGIVAAEINRGYMIGSRVLRHARVAVSKGAPSELRTEEKDD